MRKFKLIKEYPNSPPVGKEFLVGNGLLAYINYPEFWEEVKDYSELIKEAEKRYPKGTKFIPAMRQGNISEISSGEFIVNNGLFIVDKQSRNSIYHISEERWAIIKKDYEILKLKCKYSSPTHSPGNIINHVETIDCQNYYKMVECFDIHSIKRLSDGEVFTVGDMIIRNDYTVLLETIELDDQWKGGVSINKNEQPLGGECLDTLKKAYPILFTTEDGVGMFEGDKYWYVSSSFTVRESKTTKYIGVLGAIARFSTKELAKEYVDENKPKYTETDIKSFITLLDRNQEWSELYLMSLWKLYLKRDNNG